MRYTKITVAPNKMKKRDPAHVYRVTYEGVDGQWTSSGNLYEIWQVDGCFVVTTIMNKPIAMCSSMDFVIERLKKTTNCQNIVIL